MTLSCYECCWRIINPEPIKKSSGKWLLRSFFPIGYLIVPLEVISDVLPIIGGSDDISMFGFVLAGFTAELDSCKSWEKSRLSLPDSVPDKEEK